MYKIEKYLTEARSKLNFKSINKNEVLKIIKDMSIKEINKYDMPELLNDSEKVQLDHIKGVIGSNSNDIVEKIREQIEDMIEDNTEKLAKEILRDLK